MYTTQTKSTKSKSAKLPIFESDKELAAFLERNLQDSLKQLIRVSVTSLVKTELEQGNGVLANTSGISHYHLSRIG